MSDDGQIARCTELARRTWPDVDPLILATATAAGVQERSGQERLVVMVLSHPRALDALEAALLVLSEETSLRALERAGLPQSGPCEARIAELEAQLAEPREERATLERAAGELRAMLALCKDKDERIAELEAQLARIRARYDQDPWQPIGTLGVILAGKGGA